jgi:predicted RNA-binding Zn ribbon-like protein
VVETAQPRARRGEWTFELTGGALCLDFTNTVADRPRRQKEHLASYADLLSWARQAGALEPGDVRRLRLAAARRTADAEAAFTRALEVRECLFRIFAATARGGEPDRRDLVAFNGNLGETLARLRLRRRATGLAWGWARDDESLLPMLWPVVRSAADLLTSREGAQVRECASERCSWLFVDRSRTLRRRWCDMRTCGNRSKARRHYQRQKAAETCSTSQRSSSR